MAPTSQIYEAAQWILLATLVVVVLRFTRSERHESRFKPRGPRKTRREPTDALQAAEEREKRASRERTRLLLQGVVLTGLPHQILGVRPDASEFEIRKAHRNLVKRFHPDKVGSEGSREWYEAQRATEAINGARDQMLAALKASEKRSE